MRLGPPPVEVQESFRGCKRTLAALAELVAADESSGGDAARCALQVLFGLSDDSNAAAGDIAAHPACRAALSRAYSLGAPLANLATRLILDVWGDARRGLVEERAGAPGLVEALVAALTRVNDATPDCECTGTWARAALLHLAGAGDGAAMCIMAACGPLAAAGEDPVARQAVGRLLVADPWRLEGAAFEAWCDCVAEGERLRREVERFRAIPPELAEAIVGFAGEMAVRRGPARER
jgi:hypothetical protein